VDREWEQIGQSVGEGEERGGGVEEENLA
jgi:hypothetical protein